KSPVRATNAPANFACQFMPAPRRTQSNAATPPCPSQAADARQRRYLGKLPQRIMPVPFQSAQIGLNKGKREKDLQTTCLQAWAEFAAYGFQTGAGASTLCIEHGGRAGVVGDGEQAVREIARQRQQRVGNAASRASRFAQRRRKIV